LEVEVAKTASDRTAKLKLTASSAVGLASIRVFVDGRTQGEYQVGGHDASIEPTIALSPEARWITAVAIDTAGYESVPRGLELSGAERATTSRLYAIAVGTDRYDDMDRFEQLAAAKIDAANFANSLKTVERVAYGNVELASYLDAAGLRTALPEKIREVVAKAGENDTIMLFAAGHGVLDPSTGQFFLVTRETRADQLAATAIGWAEIAAALDGAKARVIVFLDACHSGAAAGGTNDDAVLALMNRKASLTVIAGAKGRQLSKEYKGTGGAFTTAFVTAITEERRATDTNANGAIELAELYAAVKRHVMSRTKGKQTPWIARNQMIGEMPLF
jgi:uncharacterized caspase-like protein